MLENILKEISEEYSKINSVCAVVLSGSRASNLNDKLSDYDIYIYTDDEIPIDFRTQLAQKHSEVYEIDNRYFETGDEWELKNYPTCFDFMFRNPQWIKDQINNVWIKHNASLGYSTCFLYNVKHSKILYDKNNWFLDLQKQIEENDYPEELQKNIIKKNLMMLKDKKSASFFEQIEKAIKRNDIISIQHRITAFLACYFDIIFAINKKLHPGEKRLIQYAKLNCIILPNKFAENLENLIISADKNKIEILSNIIFELRKILPNNIK